MSITGRFRSINYSKNGEQSQNPGSAPERPLFTIPPEVRSRSFAFRRISMG